MNKNNLEEIDLKNDASSEESHKIHSFSKI